MSSEIAIPFRLGLNGRVVAEDDPDKQIRQHVLALVATEPGERIMLPSYGVPTISQVFEPGDFQTGQLLTHHVEQALNTWEPGVRVISVGPSNTSPGDGTSGVNVEYQRADGPDVNTTARHLNVALISPGGRVREVIRG
jgi:phage baseplate assembly protein W